MFFLHSFIVFLKIIFLLVLNIIGMAVIPEPLCDEIDNQCGCPRKIFLTQTPAGIRVIILIKPISVSKSN
jgi:hypothetical protein